MVATFHAYLGGSGVCHSTTCQCSQNSLKVPPFQGVSLSIVSRYFAFLPLNPCEVYSPVAGKVGQSHIPFAASFACLSFLTNSFKVIPPRQNFTRFDWSHMAIAPFTIRVQFLNKSFELQVAQIVGDIITQFQLSHDSELPECWPLPMQRMKPLNAIIEISVIKFHRVLCSFLDAA